MVDRTLSLGRDGEAQWKRLHAAYRLSRERGVVSLVVSDSPKVRAEIRTRIESLGSPLLSVAPSHHVLTSVHDHAAAYRDTGALPTIWIEAEKEPAMHAWHEALAALNQARDGIQAAGPCHLVLVGPMSFREQLAQRAPDLAAIVSPALLLPATTESIVSNTAPLTWLHLSDLHIRSEDWQQDHVLHALHRDLPTLLAEHELKPDLLFVTGDVAARGTQTEYDGAFRFLEQIVNLLGLERTQDVFLVPGNHDVDRSAVRRPSKRLVDSWAKLGPDELRDETGAALEHAGDFAMFGERLAEWSRFTERFVGTARSVSVERPWRSDVVEVSGLAVGVLSLCTVWASGSDGENGRLVVGERQLYELTREAADGGAQLTVALMHHPLSWLHPEEQSAIRMHLERAADLVLHGHTHHARASVQLSGGSTQATIAAGAAYAGIGQDRYHGFSVGRLDPASGQLQLHNFTWSTGSGKWHTDSGVAGADGRGVVTSAFSPAGLQGTTASAGHGHAVLATRIRNAATRVFASADVAGIGVGTTRGHVALDKIYVPQQFRDGDTQHTLAGLQAAIADRTKTLRWVVLGDPGSGKSTLCKLLAVTAARREDGPVPLLLTIRDWLSEGRREGLIEMAVRQAKRQLSVTTSEDALEALCKSGDVLLLVDGIDEAADPDDRKAIRQRLHSFATDNPGIPIVATSRIVGYDQAALDPSEFRCVTLEAFDNDALELFVHRWYQVAEVNPTERSRKRADLLRALEAEPRAKELARNPLFATLIALVHFSSAQLPGDRARLYELLVRLLLTTWPAGQGRQLTELPGPMQQSMLERIALTLQERRSRTASRNPGGQILLSIADFTDLARGQIADQRPELSPSAQRELADTWTRWLLEDSGILQEHQPGKVGFLHLSIMEFLAGQALLASAIKSGHRAVAKAVLKRHDEPAWIETLLLMIGSENRNKELAETIAETLLQAPRSQWATAVFLAKMLREEANIEPSTRQRLLQHSATAATTRWPHEWTEFTQPIGHVIQFSRTHSEATKTWFEHQAETATDDLLVGTLALWPERSLDVGIGTKKLEARKDRTRTILTAMDFGARTPWGQWARGAANRQTWLQWHATTPLRWTLARSLTSHPQPDAPLGALLARAQWAADAACPPVTTTIPLHSNWTYEAKQTFTTYMGPAVQRLKGTTTKKHIHNLTRKFAQNLETDSIRRLRHNFVLGLGLGHTIVKTPSLNLDRILTKQFSIYRTQRTLQELGRGFTQDLARDFSQRFLQDLTRFPPRLFGKLFAKRKISVHFGGVPSATNRRTPEPPKRSEVWDRTTAPLIQEYLALLAAEAYAGFVLGAARGDQETAFSLMMLRLQNRWLHMFFDPLTDYLTHNRPLADNPDVHAQLLTFGLIQYQTTWQWPNTDRWREWMSSAPPTHWVSAYIWHLIRGIEDPDNHESHLARAFAALDDNDWPELAQSLREGALVPVSDETLALFNDDPKLYASADDDE